MGKRKRVPEVLWRLFGNKARCLSEAIVSLIPQHCDCRARGKCLRCVFGDGDEAAMFYLVRPNDPRDYQQLMNTCFVVLPSDAPPLPALLSFSRRWSQLQIVERTIETCLKKQAATSNLICSDYDKFKTSSFVVKLLSSSAWDLTLKRVGDSLMDYLLMQGLIFISIRPDTHQQIAGHPVNGLFVKFPIHIPVCDSLLTSHQSKRRRGDGNDTICEEPPSNLHLTADPQKSVDCVDSRNEVYDGSTSSDESSLLHLIQAAKLSKDYGLHKEDFFEEQNSKVKGKPGKRLRLPSWQRRKRCKTLLGKETDMLDPSAKVFTEVDIHKTHQHDLSSDQSKGDVMPTSENKLENQDESYLKSIPVPLLCPCCSVFQLLSPVPIDAQINRKSLFYSVERTSSLFLKNLHLFKPGFTGVNDLLRHIFGLPSIDVIRLPASWFCLHGPSCLYHSLVKLLKGLKRRAKRCPHTRLLKRHCSMQATFRIANEEAGSILQSNTMEAGVASSTCDKQFMNHGVNQPLNFSFHTKLRGCRKTSEIIQSQFGLSQPYCSKDEVISFVWAVCRNIVPPDLLGISSNRRILRRNISRFIKLRRFEKFSLKQCMHKLEISKFPLVSKKPSFDCFNASATKNGYHLQNINNCALKLTLIERWIFWFFAYIVVPLVQAHFYVTEAEHGKQNIYYYQKPVWKKLSKKVTTQLKDQNYHSLDYASVNSILKKRSFGFSKVRLCPKETGARPIANLKAPSRFHSLGFGSHAQYQQKKRKGQSTKRSKAFYFKAVNTVLRDVHVVLKDLRAKEPKNWGSSVSSYNEIYRKLCLFVKNLKEGKVGTPAAYIVVSDVEKAFDTVNQDKLLSILNEIQMEDEYTLLHSAEIFCRKKFLWVSKNLKLITRGQDNRSAAMMPYGNQKSSHTVVINQELDITVKREDLKFILMEHLKHNVLKLGRSFFLQNVGIPQGSVLSSLLCSLYYGHLERNVIFPLLTKGSIDILVQDDNGASALEATQDMSSSCAKYLLLRFVDDFLLLSTSKNQAASFLSRLQRGFREYNCYMNRDKICTNFDCGQMLELDSKRFVGSDGASFICWSGLLINCCSLEVQADYTRYLNDHMCSSLTVSCQGRPGHQLKAKLCAYMRPKCHPIFYDTTINTPATVRLNVYQAFLVCAMKFHCYVRELSTWCKLDPSSCLTAIKGSLRYMYSLMKRRMYGINHTSGRPRVLIVMKEEVIWLGLTAYVRVLNRKQSRYKKLLPLLKGSLKPLSSTGGSSELKYAVDDSHNTLLWKIKY